MLFDHPDFDHAHVAFFADPRVGLRAIVAIHRVGAIGTSGGGCRIWPYPTDTAALTDALRLSRAMSFKLALLDIPAGGAKAVVIASAADKSPALLAALGRAVDALGGRYVLGEDVGTSAEDLAAIGKVTPYVTRDASSAEATAHGVVAGIRVCVRERLERDDLRGVRVAVQGLGGVGMRVAALLADAGASLVVADVDGARVLRAVRELGARAIATDVVHTADVDVFAPCALGGVVDERTIDALRCAIVAGSANVPLAHDRLAARLAARGILFAPDFVVNAGGVIGAALPGAAGAAAAEERVPALLRAVLDASHTAGITPLEAATTMARERLGEA